jgi:nicotinamidase-related amidase
VRDAAARGYQGFLLHDAVQAVNIQPDDGKKAEEEMAACRAVFITRDMVT